MSNINLFQYTGNLFKKSLAIYTNKLKGNVSKSLENNDLQKTKEFITIIEGLNDFQKEIDSILLNYFNYFPNEKSSVKVSDSYESQNENYKRYTVELIEIIKGVEQIELFDLKSSLYQEIEPHIDSHEILTNANVPDLLNWEVYFYKAITLLLSNGFIRFDETNHLELTKKGEDYFDEDADFEEFIAEIEVEDEIDDQVFENLTEKDKNMDLITSIHSYLISNLLADGILAKEDFSRYNKVVFHIIKSLLSTDGQHIEKWEQIKENNFYKVKTYFDKNESLIFVQEKYSGYNAIKCIEEDNSTAYYAFL